MGTLSLRRTHVHESLSLSLVSRLGSLVSCLALCLISPLGFISEFIGHSSAKDARDFCRTIYLREREQLGLLSQQYEYRHRHVKHWLILCLNDGKHEFTKESTVNLYIQKSMYEYGYTRTVRVFYSFILIHTREYYTIYWYLFYLLFIAN